MPNLYITEFGGLQADPFSPGKACPVLPSLANQAVAIGGASVQSTAVGPMTRLVRVLADANCFMASGANPVAVAQTPLVAGVPEYFQVPAGQSYKLAVIMRAALSSTTFNTMSEPNHNHAIRIALLKQTAKGIDAY